MTSAQPPPSLKPVSHYLKVALEHDNRDKVISYWARFAAVQKSLTIDKSSPEAKMFVIGLLDWLETQKKELAGNEAIMIEAAGEAHIENYALKLFTWADQSDRNATFNKNVVKAFYTAGILFDILESLRPPLSDDFIKTRKYAKWKAAYIHNCLKNGETPIPGGNEEEEDDEENNEQPSEVPPASFGFTDPSRFGQDFGSTDTRGYNDNAGFGEGGAAAQPQQSFYQDFGGESNSVAVSNNPSLSVEQIAKAQKYCKWAGSALNFDDVSSAIDNLEKALHLLKTGQEIG